MKKKIIFGALAAVMLAAGFGIWRWSHPTHFRYNDRFVLGSTEAEITARYGDFHRRGTGPDGSICLGVYMIRDNTPELIMSYDDSLWYEITFENGRAVDIWLQKGVRGG